MASDLYRPKDLVEAIAATGAPMSKHQIGHRLDVLNRWEIAPGSKVLEIGCGQGDCTAVLAHLVGSEGHVTGLDPAPLDYGSPMTLGQAQDKLKAGPLGDRITFRQASLEPFLASDLAEPVYDCAVFCRCLWYLPSPETLLPMLAALRGRARRLLIAEYTLDTRGDIAALPHLLATLSIGNLNSGAFHPATEIVDNVQSIITPKMIREIAEKAGWKLESEEVVEAADEVEDGGWEVGHVLSKKYGERVHLQEDKGRRDLGQAILEAVQAAKAALGPGATVKTLPSWSASWT